MNAVIEKIESPEFGAHSNYARNYARNAKNGFTNFCAHCAKAMDETAGFEIQWRAGQGEPADGSLYPVAAVVDGAQFKRIGSECIKHFVTKEQMAVYARKVAA